MVDIEAVQESNKLISTSFSGGLVAVFVGATSGIGEYTLLEFSRRAPKKSRIYFFGRSKEAGERIKAQCEKLDSQCIIEFIASDVSLLKNVDVVCRQIKGKESHINLLFQTQGSIGGSTVTNEGMTMPIALLYSRIRFTVNFLPLINAAPLLRRVVSVGAGTTEGAVDLKNLDFHNMSMLKMRAQQTSMLTLSMEALAEQNPAVSFVHGYPGPVQSQLYRDMKGLVKTPLRHTLNFLYRFYHISVAETGQRHVFMSTSSRYPPRVAVESDGVGMGKGVEVARGTDGVTGSGCYCATQPCDEGSANHFELLEKFRDDGTRDKVWRHIETKFVEITGTTSA